MFTNFVNFKAFGNKYRLMLTIQKPSVDVHQHDQDAPNDAFLEMAQNTARMLLNSIHTTVDTTKVDLRSCFISANVFIPIISIQNHWKQLKMSHLLIECYLRR